MFRSLPRGIASLRSSQGLSLGKNYGALSRFENKMSLSSPFLRSMSTASTVEAETPKKQSMWDKYMGPQADQASPSFRNRWAMVAPAFLTHMCIGSPCKSLHASLFIQLCLLEKNQDLLLLPLKLAQT